MCVFFVIDTTGWVERAYNICQAQQSVLFLYFIHAETRIIARDFHSILWKSDYNQRFPLKSTETWKYRKYRFCVMKFPLSPLFSTHGIHTFNIYVFHIHSICMYSIHIQYICILCMWRIHTFNIYVFHVYSIYMYFLYFLYTYIQFLCILCIWYIKYICIPYTFYIYVFFVFDVYIHPIYMYSIYFWYKHMYYSNIPYMLTPMLSHREDAQVWHIFDMSHVWHIFDIYSIFLTYI